MSNFCQNERGLRLSLSFGWNGCKNFGCEETRPSGWKLEFPNSSLT